MSITQINVWCCEVCPYQAVSVTHDVRAYSDPVVTPPNDIPWGFIVRDRAERDRAERMACPHCLAKEKA